MDLEIVGVDQAFSLSLTFLTFGFFGHRVIVNEILKRLHLVPYLLFKSVLSQLVKNC